MHEKWLKMKLDECNARVKEAMKPIPFVQKLTPIRSLRELPMPARFDDNPGNKIDPELLQRILRAYGKEG